jgi:hypothetical protein
MNYLESLLESNPPLFQKMLVHVRKIAWDKLSGKIRNYFLSILPGMVSVGYNVDHVDREHQKIFISVDRSCDNLITRRLSEPVRFENGEQGCITNVIRNRNSETYQYLTFTSFYGEELDEITPKGTLRYFIKSKEHIVSYSFTRKTKRGKMKFYIDPAVHGNDVKLPGLKKGVPFSCNNIRLNFHGGAAEKIQTGIGNLVLEISGIHDTIAEKGEFIFFRSLITRIRRSENLLLHPGQFVNKPIVEEMRASLDNQVVADFIRKVGMTCLFADKMDVRLGIIRSIADNNVHVFCLERRTFLNLPVPIGKCFSPEDIVVIEDDDTISLPSMDIEGKVPFEEGIITAVNEVSQDGFILNNDRTRDYHFSFKSCDFKPSAGDNVKFVVIRNEWFKYEENFMTVKISKTGGDMKTCVILTSRVNKLTENVSGIAEDIENGQLFKFSMTVVACRKIRNLTGIPLQGKYFSYILGKNKPGPTDYPGIKLLELTADEN